MALKTTKWDTAEHLKTPEDIALYLEAAFEDGDGALIRLALGNVARSIGITEISRTTGLSREALYKALGENGNPTLDTLQKVMKALGLQLAVKKVA